MTPVVTRRRRTIQSTKSSTRQKGRLPLKGAYPIADNLHAPRKQKAQRDARQLCEI
jgi:hypothetical protein